MKEQEVNESERLQHMVFGGQYLLHLGPAQLAGAAEEYCKHSLLIVHLLSSKDRSCSLDSWNLGYNNKPHIRPAQSRRLFKDKVGCSFLPLNEAPTLPPRYILETDAFSCDAQLNFVDCDFFLFFAGSRWQFIAQAIYKDNVLLNTHSLAQISCATIRTANIMTVFKQVPLVPPPNSHHWSMLELQYWKKYHTFPLINMSWLIYCLNATIFLHLRENVLHD